MSAAHTPTRLKGHRLGSIHGTHIVQAFCDCGARIVGRFRTHEGVRIVYREHIAAEAKKAARAALAKVDA